MAAASRSLTTIVAAMVKNAAIMAPLTNFAADTVEKVVDDPERDQVLLPSFPPQSGLDSSCDESQTDQEKKG